MLFDFGPIFSGCHRQTSCIVSFTHSLEHVMEFTRQMLTFSLPTRNKVDLLLDDFQLRHVASAASFNANSYGTVRRLNVDFSATLAISHVSKYQVQSTAVDILLQNEITQIWIDCKTCTDDDDAKSESCRLLSNFRARAIFNKFGPSAVR